MQQPKTHLAKLIADSHRAPTLSRSEEVELVRKWQSERDRAAGDKLARCNMRYVVFIALRFQRYGIALDELIAEGALGLLRAADRFDPDRGTRFSTYAAYWIRSYVVDFIMRSWSLVGGGRGALNTRTFFRLRRERSKANGLFGPGAQARAAVAEAMNISEAKLTELEQQLDVRDLSLYTPTSDGSSTALVDCLQAEVDVAAEYERKDNIRQFHSSLNEALDALNDRERYIVQHRLMSDTQQSLATLGRRFGVSRERTRQIEQRAKEKLLNYVAQKHPTSHIAARANRRAPRSGERLLES